jgi:hypothetical protein
MLLLQAQAVRNSIMTKIVSVGEADFPNMYIDRSTHSRGKMPPSIATTLTTVTPMSFPSNLDYVTPLDSLKSSLVSQTHPLKVSVGSV